MNRDPLAIGRAQVGAETFAGVVNSFVDPISWKTMVRLSPPRTLALCLHWTWLTLPHIRGFFTGVHAGYTVLPDDSHQLCPLVLPVIPPPDARPPFSRSVSAALPPSSTAALHWSSKA